ncbi:MULTISPECIES: DUF2271 domain-containing protein [Pseudomonadaceae]|uniref:DUF2271 domain-containing protein n=1 Tax=Pseudomonadaceae TaxID=135621 RepID=UPI001038B671|nr:MULTISPECIES: DUF2271 domain-containing protein [Pseudomonadaceae]MBA1276867.1 DUF2271 domain-containing protein [Stutzerimonas stutzeri]MBC8651103.1 DUF2271 domain-containing protein [Pseudomonas sp. MT4]QXY93324.1 DUF2271 domain-containing protein [Pseudomonas sp. MTM4]TCD22985.1 DUF2271 domain-containing protein [Pseudomonas sp. IC_126]
MRKTLLLPLALLSAPLMAADLKIEVEIPRLQVAEYHRPYVALWLEQPDKSHVANLAVWYDLKLKDNEGEKWLKDMREWWRRSGRSLDMPVDGVSGATRAVGTHSLSFTDKNAPLNTLPAGEYRLVVEAAREVGGRELLRLPFSWPPEKTETHQAQGESELGTVTLELTQ